jgi:3-phosphoglycerate kinase
MRRKMLVAIVSRFEDSDPAVVESFLEGQGFEIPIKLTDDEAEETARRVRAAVEEPVLLAERQEVEKRGEKEVSDDAAESGSEWSGEADEVSGTPVLKD